ncbi:MAG: hypothetical protein IPK68_23220 [Bdellovibrionales bacterium]|nr:hypothetical protein [Bdellovibrionales bacterium]
MKKNWRVFSDSSDLGFCVKMFLRAAKAISSAVTAAGSMVFLLFFVGVHADANGAGRRSPCQLSLMGFARAQTVFSTSLAERVIFEASGGSRDLMASVPNMVLPSAPVYTVLVMAALGAGEDTSTRRDFFNVLGIDPTLTSENLIEIAGDLIKGFS